MSLLVDLVLGLFFYDLTISFISLYSFYILILRPYFHNRNRVKNGLIADLYLYDKGIYKGSMTLNISELIDYLFAEIKASTNKPESSDQQSSDQQSSDQPMFIGKAVK